LPRIREFFEPGGGLSRAHAGYEHRPGQLEMALAVDRVLDEGGILMVEAGTGTGKTLAYLVPVIERGERVVVSTGTRNLQDQIFENDLPFLKDRAGFRVSACVMKGRENYLCRLRFAQFDAEPMLEVLSERSWLPKIRAWSRATTVGDRAEIPDLPDSLRLWRDINARADTCVGKQCPEFELCHLTQLKRRAQQSQILVVNHHLFFADLAVRSAYGAVLPDYDRVIFDEAHLLEDIATLYFGVQVSSSQIDELAREAERQAERSGRGRRGSGGAAALRLASRDFFDTLRDELDEDAGRARFQPADRGGPDVDAEWEVLRQALEEVGREARVLEEGEGSAGALAERAEEIRDAVATVLHRRDSSFVYGIELRGRGHVHLSALPIDVARPLRESLFDHLRAGVLTSATLTVDGRFDFFQQRLGLEEAETLVVESPFRPRDQAVLYLPKVMPEPREALFAERVGAEILELLEITSGRAFLLFTSYATMDKVRAILDQRSAWKLFVQGEGSKAALVDSFKSTPAAALLGTTSFWHGVDVPGEALSLVVIDKLPFDVPGEPLIAARIERIREDGGDPFRDYQVPLAVLELKQGLGRLLRTRSDRGILAVLDPRLVSRSYGRRFLASLPAYRIVHDLESCRKFFRGEIPT
jgi:ATP-dependent DNA helicase DinG